MSSTQINSNLRVAAGIDFGAKVASFVQALEPPENNHQQFAEADEQLINNLRALGYIE